MDAPSESNNLSGSIGEVRMTIEVKRKETGQVEKYELVGKIGDTDGSNALNNS